MSNLDLSTFFAQFREETEDNVRALTAGLLALEGNPTDRPTLDTIFRAAHTIKGSARMLGQVDMGRLAHAMEGLLDLLRSAKLVFNPEHNDVLLACVDVLLTLNRKVSEPPPTDERVAGLLQRLESVSQQTEQNAKPVIEQSAPRAEPVVVPTVSPVKDVPPPVSAPTPQPSSTSSPAPITNPAIRPTIRVPITRLDRLLNTVGELVITTQATANQQVSLENVQILLKKQERMLQQLTSIIGHVPARFRKHVDVQDLKYNLINASGQAQNMLHQLAQDLVTHSTSVDGLVNELEAEVIATRLQPIAGLFAPIPRAVRELARSLGKEARLITEGETTEADRKVIETLSEPMMHLIRNALDHGIETPAERVALNKPAEATLRLAARSLGGTIEIRISDDGRGIDPAVIREVAVKRGIMTSETVQRLRDDEALELLWQAGFSTSSIITDVSGRGVGLDVVRTAVSDIGGHVTIESTLGQGTTFILTVPSTLLTTRVMIVDISGTLYAVPSTSCIGGRRVRTEDIHMLQGRPTIRLNEQTIPIVALGTLMGQQGPLPDPSMISHLLILAPANRPLALLVERLVDEREVVVKALGPILAQQRLCSGAIVLPDGQLVLVLNPAAIVDRAREIGRPVQAPQIMVKRAPAKLLIAEDSFTTRELLRSMLQSVGYVVETAINGRDAFDKITTNSYDLLVTDIEMPYINGFELTRQVRANQQTSQLPVIIITSLSREADRREGLLAGAQAYIVKSQFDQNSLLDTIHQLLGR